MVHKGVIQFKPGDKVIKTLTGFGGSEEEERTVHSVEHGVVYLASSSSSDRENGITYDAKTGRERERFFPGMLATIRQKRNNV